MKSTLILNLLFCLIVASNAQKLHSRDNDPPCRFAQEYNISSIIQNPEPFIQNALYWEGHFVQPGIGYNGANGMTYDGTLLNQTTGLPLMNGSVATGRHNFSAASKESLHIMLLAQVLAGNRDAARVVAPGREWEAKEVAYEIMEKKLETYLQFNETYPGFGGLLPWYNNTYAAIEPTNDWVNRLPALDNGELLWAVYAAVQALSTCHETKYQKLGEQWQSWLDYTKTTAAKMFYYYGNGTVCAVITLNQTLPPNDPNQKYACENGTNFINDPYEGELFTWWLYFFSPSLSPSSKESLWLAKRPQLQSVDYTMSSFGPITVQRGYWFSSHEQWKLLEMPYLDTLIAKRIFTNAERVRTCNSFLLSLPGEYASVNNITNTTTNQIIGYISNAGIPPVSFLPDQELDVITPYAVFPTLLVRGEEGRKVGMAWYWNMLSAGKMQNPQGSTESLRVDGTAISSFVSWDSKITSVVALLGGVQDLVRGKMKTDGVYEEFVRVVEREYGRVFTDIKGEDVDLCLPTARVPDRGLSDYTACEAK